MKRLSFAAACLSVLTVVPASAASAGGATVNFGQCLKIAPKELKRYQAPAQSGNGPLVIVNGRLIYPAAFAGGIGCAL